MTMGAHDSRHQTAIIGRSSRWMVAPRGLVQMAAYADVAAPVAEMRCYLETGIDGLFSDDSAIARRAIGG